MRKFSLILFAIIFAMLSRVATPAEFFHLGDLPGGTFSSMANDVSDNGAVVVGDANSASGTEAFRWNAAGGMVGLGDLSGGSFLSEANGVSADGSVVVGNGNSASGTEAFRWTAAGGMVGLGDLPGGSFWSGAAGVSADGSVVVGSSSSASGTQPFRWTSAGGMVGLGQLPGTTSGEARNVSADGAVVVGECLGSSETWAFRWTAGGGMVSLGDLPGGYYVSYANSVSADGAIVVGYSSSTSGGEAFRWTSTGGMVGLGDLAGGSFLSEAKGVSADGTVVVGYGNSALGQEAFLWDAASGMRNLRQVLIADYGLDLTGWTLTSAKSVSANGRAICGTGTNPAGNQEAFLVLLDPLQLNWQRTSNGLWDEPGNWDYCHPATKMTDVRIQPNIGLTVTGPSAATTIKSLTFGASPNGIATLALQAGGPLNVTRATTITAGGRIAGSGILNALGGINNWGEIDMGNHNLQVSGDILQNDGVIRGSGVVANVLWNTTNGQVRVAAGERMVFSGEANNNDGTIRVIGGELEFHEMLTNTEGTGTVFARDATLTFGGEGLYNLGSLGVSFGTTDIFGVVTNEFSGKIVLSGNSNTTFYGDVYNGGLLKVSAGSTAVFFGDLQGTPTGSGTIYIEGDLAPGGGGMAELAGSLPTSSDENLDANIVNDSSAGLIVTGTNVKVGDITGGGNIHVYSGASLTAKSIRQNSLIIGGAASDASSVPEPSLFVLTSIGILGLMAFLRGKKVF